MRCLVISDIHANLAAFEAVLNDAKTRALNYDIVWCLGDVVGYGPDPNECVELLRTLPHVCLAGNHDWAVLGKLDIETFNDNAVTAIQWTRAALRPESARYLQARPERMEQGDYLLVHASPRRPIWEYILDNTSAEENFSVFNQQYCLVGHTHVPVSFVLDSRNQQVRMSHLEHNLPISLRRNNRYILNVGSVGQPRDGDPRGAYALLDTSAATWTLYRVEYNIAQTQQRMRAADLPEKLITRIEYGR
jgi:diadenosine tetraphosphatase ApaH/serine/threonine PP2A family protein phosphatase